MKRITSIVLIALLFFNWYGYRFFFNYLQNKADRELNLKLDENKYDESQLIEIKLPINLPYQYTTSAFERSYGEIEYDGKIYSYVKRKIEDGFVILKCIPNIQKERIKDAKHLMVKLNSGIDQDHNGRSSLPLAKVFKSLLSDYHHNNLDFPFFSFDAQKQQNRKLSSYYIHQGFLFSVEQPPDLPLIYQLSQSSLPAC